MAEAGSRHSNLDLIVGVVLGAIVATVLVATGYHLTHTVQKDARLMGLPIPVHMMPAAARTVHETIGASGTTQPSVPVDMTAKVVSRVLRVPVYLGMVVRPRNLLVDLDSRLFQANLERARLKLDHAAQHKSVCTLEPALRPAPSFVAGQ